MKVKRGKVIPTFEPIVITLETEKEAECLWHRLNASASSPFTDYAEKADYMWTGIAPLMWEKLNEVYRPEEADA